MINLVSYVSSHSVTRRLASCGSGGDENVLDSTSEITIGGYAKGDVSLYVVNRVVFSHKHKVEIGRVIIGNLF